MLVYVNCCCLLCKVSSYFLIFKKNSPIILGPYMGQFPGMAPNFPRKTLANPAKMPNFAPG